MGILRSLVSTMALLLILAPTVLAQSSGGRAPTPGLPGAPSTGSGINSNSGINSKSTPGSTFTPGASAVGMTSTQATSSIQAQGYTDVRNLQRVGNTYTGTAVRDGQTVPVTINANTGQMQ